MKKRVYKAVSLIVVFVALSVNCWAVLKAAAGVPKKSVQTGGNATSKSGMTYKQVRVDLLKQPNDQIKKIVSVFIQQVESRCPAKISTQVRAPLTLVLALDPTIGQEGFRIKDTANGGIEVAGHNELGVLYGLGKLLRTSRYSKDGFSPGAWRGESVPQKSIRGMYFATHFHNFYMDGPVEDVCRYVEELALWGCNNLMVWYDMNHFKGFEDPKAVAFRKRLGAILQTAGDLGLGTAFIAIGNEGYANSPTELRSKGGGRGGYYPSQICPSKPVGLEYRLRTFSEFMNWVSPYNPKYVCIWPFDQGGCDCAECRPWATKGFLKCARPIADAARKKYPNVEIILSNWMYRGNETRELGKILAAEPAWVDLVMAAVPGTTIPAVNFPEISMLGVQPWGGFGAIPVPQHLQNKYAKMDNLKGGWPYSEGLFEDMNKAAMLQLFWNPKQPTIETLREYASFEFAPQVANDVVAMVRILEKNFKRRRGIGATAIEAYKLAQKVDAQLSPDTRKNWRWRILYLRALIDKEMHLTKGALKGKVLKDSFAELTDIYHAENALPGWLIPPNVKDGAPRVTEDLNPDMDLDPTTVASSEFGSDYRASKAHDGIVASQNANNFWASANRQDIGAWWQKDLGARISIAKIQIQFREIDGVFHFVPKTITFQVSDDGKKWTTVIGKSANVPVNGKPYSDRMYVHDLKTEGKYVRLLFEDGTDDNVGGFKLVELVEVKVIN